MTNLKLQPSKRIKEDVSVITAVLKSKITGKYQQIQTVEELSKLLSSRIKPEATKLGVIKHYRKKKN